MTARALRLACLLGLAGMGATVGAEPWPVLPLAGELAGKFQLTDDSGLPEVSWRVQVVPGDAGALRAELNATASGLKVRVALTPPRDGAAGTWSLLESEVALADWWEFVLARAGVAVQPPDLRLAGTLRVTGEGTWDGSVWRGTLRAAVTEARAGSEAQGWSASEVGVVAELAFTEKSATFRTAEVRAGTVQVAGVTVRHAVLEFAGGEQGRVEVRRAQLEAFGGRLALAPFTVDPAAPAVRTAAEFSEIALGELAALVPQALAEARGQIAGKISVNWSLASMVEPSAGGLEIAPGLPATFRLASSPGLLTGRAPPRIGFLPGWAGPARKWFSIQNPAYDTLHRIELGEVPLTMENLRVQLFPDGPDGGRTLHLEVAARPPAGSAVKLVTFSVNLSGPLTEVLRLGTDSRAKIQLTPRR